MFTNRYLCLGSWGWLSGGMCGICTTDSCDAGSWRRPCVPHRTGQSCQDEHYSYRCPEVCLVLRCTFVSFRKAALVYCRKRLRLAVSCFRRGVGGLAQRFLSLLSYLSMPTCPQTCKLRFLTPRHLELARYFPCYFLYCLVFVTKRTFDPDYRSQFI